jgi:hypothetical protein
MTSSIAFLRREESLEVYGHELGKYGKRKLIWAYLIGIDESESESEAKAVSLCKQAASRQDGERWTPTMGDQRCSC